MGSGFLTSFPFAFLLIYGAFLKPAQTSAAPVPGSGLSAVYFGQQSLAEPKFVRIDSNVDFNWGTASPAPSVPADWFSVRWSGMVKPRFTETCTFYVRGSDGMRLWINNQLVIDYWEQQETTESSGTIALRAHQLYDIKLEYFESTNVAEVHLSWSSASVPKEIIPKDCLFSGDALHHRVRRGLKTFCNWLNVNHAGGFIGEFGWPDDFKGEALQWNALAEAWFIDADVAGLSAAQWATGEWYSDTYFSVYEKTSGSQFVNSANAQATILEAHPSTTNYLRGINNPGGEYGGPNVVASSEFSNQNIGVYNSTYHFDSQATMDYFAARSNRLVRIPFRWERIQQNLGQSLTATELQRLKDAVTRARNAGLQVVIDMHNYGAYYLHDGTQNKGVRHPIGSTQVTTNHFANVWQQLSCVFKNDASVFYGLMNEPVNMGSVDDWKLASQAAVNAIRSNSDNKMIYVSGYNWSGVTQFPVQHPTGWITDPANNFAYEAHHYWDSDGSGGYASSYASEVYKAEVAGFGSRTLIFETEALDANFSHGITNSIFSDSKMSNGQGSKLNSTASNQFVAYPIHIPEARVYTIRVGVKKQNSRGKFQLVIGDANQGSEQDNFSPVDDYAELNLGQKAFVAIGTKQFTFKIVGRNANSGGDTLAIDYIKLTPDPLDAFYETENARVLSSSNATIQAITEVNLRGGTGDKFNSNATGDFLTYAIDVPEARSYKILIGVKKQDARGMFQLAIDGASQGTPQDNYSVADIYEELDLGTKSFTRDGIKEFRFTVTGKNPQSLGYTMLLDYIRLVPQ